MGFLTLACRIRELSVIRQGLIWRGFQGVLYSLTRRRVWHSPLYPDMTSGPKRRSRSRSLTSRVLRMRLRISSKKFKYYLSWILLTSQSLSLCSYHPWSKCSGVQVSRLISQGIPPVDCHGVLSRHWQSFCNRLTVFCRYCSGGSCSDLVGLLVTHSL